MNNQQEQGAKKSNDVIITRIINFPREKVFQLWADPQHLPRWFAPRGCSIRFKELDITEGGRFHSCVRTPDLKDCWCVGTYLEIVRPERIVYRIAIADEEGNQRSSASAGMDPDWPEETLVTITFKDLGKKTELTIHQTADVVLAQRTGAYPSWLQMIDIMEETLAAGITQ